MVENLEKLSSFINSKVMIVKAETKEYYVMNRDVIVAEVVDDKVSVINSSLCPSQLLISNNFNSWLSDRSIDIHRKNSRLLRKVLRIKSEVERDIVLSVNGVSVTDTYWVKEKLSNLTYDDVVFKEDYFHEVSLLGDMDKYYSTYVPNSIIKIDSKDRFKMIESKLGSGLYDSSFFTWTDKILDINLNPQLTLTGSFEKCWRLVNGIWYMIKQGSPKELYSEMLTYKLCKYFNFSVADYEVSDDRKYIISKNFVPKNYCFEDMYSFLGDEQDYLMNIKVLEYFNGDLFIKEYLNIVFMDCLVRNPDRHTHNYGVLRDELGQFVSMAPNFDNNLSLIATSSLLTSNPDGDILIDEFLKVLECTGSYFEFPSYKEDEIRYICLNTAEGLIDKDLALKCYNFIIERLKFLENSLK